MLSRALDESNDIFTRQGSSAMVRDGAEVVQHVRSRLLFYLEECVWDTGAGVPYFQRIFVKPANLPAAEAILKREIILTPGVKALVDFALSYNRDTRKLRVTWEAETIYDTIVGTTLNLSTGVLTP